MRDLPFPRFEVGLAIVAIAVLVLVIGGRPPITEAASVPATAPVDVWAERGAAVATIARARPGVVGVAVVDSRGRQVIGYNADNLVPAASTIKSMILAAYLRQPGVADRALTRAEQGSMTAMITWSSNNDASSLLRKAGWPAMVQLAQEAGMGDGFMPDRRSWGLSKVSAASMARYFHLLPSLLPERHRDFALSLFHEIVPDQQWGMPSVTPNGWSWHTKAGWLDEVVNQLGTFTRGGQEFSVAVTVKGAPGTGSTVSSAPGDVPAIKTIERLTKAIFGDGTIPTPAGGVVQRCGTAAQTSNQQAAVPRWASSSGDCAEVTARSR